MSESPLFIQSLEKGLRVLESFEHHESMTLQQIAQAADISTSSAQRVAHTLERLGYINREGADKRYRLDIRALKLGYPFLANERLLQSAHTILHRLHQECEESVNLSIPDGNEMVFVMRIPTFKHIPVYMPTGARLPITATASGRAILAGLPPDECEQMLSSAKMVRHTPNTTLEVKALAAIIHTARNEGFAYAAEEFFAGDINVAAAVYDENRRPIAAVNISVPMPRWDLDRARHELGPMARRAARAISAA